MGINDDKRLNKSEYFDLRERRLKLVYKILYAVVAIWIAVVLCAVQADLKHSTIPIFSFILSSSSMVIIQITKYAIMEFRCMKIIGHLDEDLINQTESRYDDIWVSFSLILSLCGLALIPHYIFLNRATLETFIVIFSICSLYFSVISIIKISKRTFKEKIIHFFDVFDIIIGSVEAYSLCAAFGLILSTHI